MKKTANGLFSGFRENSKGARGQRVLKEKLKEPLVLGNAFNRYVGGSKDDPLGVRQ